MLLPHSEPKKNFDDYKYCDDGPNKLSVCGEGRYGSVHRVENKNTGETFAMKIFRPNNNNNYQMWQKEYEHLRKVSSKFFSDPCLSSEKFYENLFSFRITEIL